MITELQVDLGPMPDPATKMDPESAPRCGVRLLLDAGVQTTAIFSQPMRFSRILEIRQALVGFGLPAPDRATLHDPGMPMDFFQFDAALGRGLAGASAHILVRLLGDPRVIRLEADGRWLRGADARPLVARL